nr:2201_t:CDS:2 [Entrophospora candida]
MDNLKDIMEILKSYYKRLKHLKVLQTCYKDDSESTNQIRLAIPDKVIKLNIPEEIKNSFLE